MTNGSCLCGQVAFTIAASDDKVAACHCTQCRKTSGHYWSAVSVPMSGLTFQQQAGLKWFRSSGFAKRGFCCECGSSLFFQLDRAPDVIEVAMGCIDAPTDITLTRHIFVAEKGDYYQIGKDGAAQFEKN